MSRPIAQSVRSRTLMALSITLLLVLSVLPLRAIGWLGWFGNLTGIIVTPIRHPFSVVSRWISPPRAARSDEAVRALEEELEHARQLYLQTQDENEKLRATIQELQRGIALNPDLVVQQLSASVTGAGGDLSSSLLHVRAGEKHGVTINTVATAPGLQLLGRVVQVSARTCQVQPITSKAAGPIRARVMLDDDAGSGLECLLSPSADNTLRGPVEDARGIEPSPGQIVRLADSDRWPASAQMLLVGRVESVEPDPNQPLRKVVIVRPSLKLDRVSEVVLRISADAAELDVQHKGGPR